MSGFDHEPIADDSVVTAARYNDLYRLYSIERVRAEERDRALHLVEARAAT